MSRQPGDGEGAGRSPGEFAGARRQSDWILFALLTVLVASAAILAIYTTSIYRVTNALRQETYAVSEPTLRAAQYLMVSVALEMDALDRYELTGNPAALADYRRTTVDRRAAVAALDSLAREMDGEPRQRWRELSDLLVRWETATPGPDPSPQPPGQIALPNESLFREVLLGATAFQRALSADLYRARERIDAAERLDLFYTLALAFVALGASVYIAWLVTRVRKLAEVAERRRVEVEAAMENRGRFIRGVTHDVKNPLGSADGAAQLLELGMIGPLTDAQLDMVARVRRGIGGALRIISDMLELSRAEAGQLEITVEPTDVVPIVAELVDEYRIEAESAGLVLTADLPDGLARPVTDGARVHEVIGNLLSNAIKYTPEGGRIAVSAESRTDGSAPAGGPWLALSVADTGVGIAPEEQERIFEEFYRAKGTAGEKAGVGLGLAISRRIARLLGGDLTVASESGRGSSFTLWIPLRPVAPRQQGS